MIQTTEASTLTINTWGYQLQQIKESEISQSPFELLVIDYSRDGLNESAWSRKEIANMKEKEKIILSYISIGEAEDYRYYWQNDWKLESPEWLDEENSNWKGNYKVKYWMKSWQSIILSYLDIIIEQGFDGVYLDIIDAYYYYENQGMSEAENEMIDWVMKIADYTRTINSEFLIFPQNGEELLENTTYRSIIDGIGIEDLYYLDENEKNTEMDIEKRENYLEMAVTDKKVVLTVDYINNSAKQNEVYQRSTDNGFVPYFTSRDLDTLTIPFFITENNSVTASFLGIENIVGIIGIIASFRYYKKKKLE